jgi:hypothetical protein
MYDCWCCAAAPVCVCRVAGTIIQGARGDAKVLAADICAGKVRRQLSVCTAASANGATAAAGLLSWAAQHTAHIVHLVM